MSSCKKDSDNFEAYPLNGNVSQLINELLDDPQTFKIIPNSNQLLTLDKTLELLVNEESLMELNEKDIDLHWKGTHSSVEMELLKLPNYNNGKYLKNVFSFEISTSQGEEEVDINNQVPLELRVEVQDVEEAQLFFLSNEGWSNLGSQSLEYVEWTDANGLQKQGFVAKITKNGWFSISTQEELYSETFSNFCIELPGEYLQGNTKSFVILANGIVIPMSRTMQQGTFCTSMEIPNDQTMKLVVLSSLRKGNYQLFISEQEMQNGLIVAPVMEEKTVDQIRSIIKDI